MLAREYLPWRITLCVCVFLSATFTSPVGDIFIDTSFDYCSCCYYCWNDNFIDTLVRRQSNFMKVNTIFKRIVYFLCASVSVCVLYELSDVAQRKVALEAHVGKVI